MMSRNESLIAATSDPISAEDMELLASQNGEMPDIDFKKLAKVTPIRRLKVGDKYFIGRREMEVDELETGDRAMVAYLGPAPPGTPPFRVYKSTGIWQVQTQTILIVRKTAARLMKSQKENAKQEPKGSK